MNPTDYPTSLAGIQNWSRQNRKPTSEGAIRFMEFVVLNCIASDASTAGNMVLKGGNALRFAYGSPRSTKDLDFSVTTNRLPDDGAQLRTLLDRAFRYAERRFNVKAKCQRIKRNPQGTAATRQTYDVAVGYQFPTDRYFQDFGKRHVSTVIPLEISFNDLVCETSPCAGIEALQVCSLEDILAEKLRSLLQQKTRNRNRCQDVYDISKCAGQGTIDRNKVAEYLLRKSAIREIDARKSSFDDVIRDMAAVDYERRIREQAPHDFIPFEKAWQDVMALVQSLEIPD